MYRPVALTLSCLATWLVAGCVSTFPGAPVSDTAGSAGWGKSVSYWGLQVDVTQDPNDSGMGVALSPPNVVLTAQAPNTRIEAIDYLITRVQDVDRSESFHVLGGARDQDFSVDVPILRFRAGDYKLEAFAAGGTTSFASAALRISGSSPAAMY
jgi:hypothetical protein